MGSQGSHHQRHRSGAVHIIIAIDQHFLLAIDGLLQTPYGNIHILHQKGVVQLVQAGVEEITGFLIAGNPPAYQYFGQRQAHINGLR